MDGRETEAKFYVGDLEQVRERLLSLQAPLVRARQLERNTRYDLPGAQLRAQGRVLRLRQDTQARLTYKGPSALDNGTLSREEVEFTVGDFEQARRFLEGLGYVPLVYYEKYRTVHDLGDAHVMLDEMPYGNFVEIEADTVEAIRAAAEQLGLRWEAAIGTSYHALFDRLRERLDLHMEDLSFESFGGRKITPQELGVLAAD